MVKRIFSHFRPHRAADWAGAEWTPLPALDERTWVSPLRFARGEDAEQARRGSPRPKGRKTGAYHRAGLLALDEVAMHRIPPKGDEQGSELAITTPRGLPLHSPITRTSARPRLLLAGQRNRQATLGTTALLTPHKQVNYFHWITEVLGNLWLLQQAGYERSAIDHYLLPFTGAEWQATALERAGVPADRVLPVDELRGSRVRRLLIPSWGDVTSHSLPAWLTRGIHASCAYTPSQQPGTRRIYISRGDAARRGLLNEQALTRLLERFGFEHHVCGGLSLPQQQALFAEAGVIVALHGAALTNLLWCAPGTEVLELHAHRHQGRSFHLLARQLGLRYQAVSVAGPGHSSRTREDDLQLSDEDLGLIDRLLQDATGEQQGC
nr:glycosyltransferase family 61 protein [Halorhodospira halophila]